MPAPSIAAATASAGSNPLPAATGPVATVLVAEAPKPLDAEEAKAKQHIQDVNKKYFDWYIGKENNLKENEVRWCLHGAYYGKIQPNGDVLRCCTPVSVEKRADLMIGNILDPEFRLLEGAKQGDISPCFCWKPMLLDQDETWKPLWRFETYAKPESFIKPESASTEAEK